MAVKPACTSFRSPEAFRAWLEANHDRASELWVRLDKTTSGRPTLSYKQAVDEALAFGWIDGLRKNVDALSYQVRFSPRKRNSIWSVVNTRRAQELLDAGRMAPPGIKAFEQRNVARSGLYSFESRPRRLSPAFEKRFKAMPAAWRFFSAQPPGYRRTASFWVMSAKKEETRLRRLAALIDDSRRGLRLAMLTGNGTKRRST